MERAWHVLTSDDAASVAVPTVAGILDRLTPSQRSTFWERLEDRAALMDPDSTGSDEAVHLAHVLPAVVTGVALSDKAKEITNLAHQAVITLDTAAGRLSHPGSTASDHTQATSLSRVAEDLVFALISTLPAPASADFVYEWVRGASWIRVHFSEDVVQRMASAATARIADFVESLPNVFDGYRPNEPIRAAELLWLWRALAGTAAKLDEGETEPRIADYLASLLASHPLALSDVLSLAASWYEVPKVNRARPASDTIRSLREVCDVERLRQLTAAAVERGVVDAMRWPDLVREINEQVWSQMPPLDGAPASGEEVAEQETADMLEEEQ